MDALGGHVFVVVAVVVQIHLLQLHHVQLANLLVDVSVDVSVDILAVDVSVVDVSVVVSAAAVSAGPSAVT